MKFPCSFLILLAFFLGNQAVAAEASPEPVGTTKTAVATPAKNEAGKNASQKDSNKQQAPKKQGTKKASQPAQSGWNKFTRSVKQGSKKPTCTPVQKSLNQCK